MAAAYRELFLASGGGALGLFTAIGRLRAVHQRIAGALEEAGLPLYAQHVGGMDAATLVDIFRAEEHSCLLGTDAVRDGVDVPGRSLRLIVFDRVPWPRPDILHRARKSAWKAELGGGANAYDDMLARLRLKQAFGRLIRRADDRGHEDVAVRVGRHLLQQLGLELRACRGRDHEALRFGGYEIMDKSGQREIYIDGPAAELFRKDVQELINLNSAATQPAIEKAIALTRNIEKKLDTVRGYLVPADLEVSITRNYGETATEKADELLFHLAVGGLRRVLRPSQVRAHHASLTPFEQPAIEFSRRHLP